jgi:hypothetical protein
MYTADMHRLSQLGLQNHVRVQSILCANNVLFLAGCVKPQCLMSKLCDPSHPKAEVSKRYKANTAVVQTNMLPTSRKCSPPCCLDVCKVA